MLSATASGGTLRLVDVQHRFAGGAYLFAPLTVTLLSGRSHAITGPSGSGKSTLLSIMAGWSSPTNGTVERDQVATIGWVFQNPHGMARRSALDHVVLPLLAAGARRRHAEAEAADILDRFGLASVADRPFRALSGGEAQRLMLARAVASAPDLLLVDEPTAQLDAATAATVNDTLAHIATGGSIVVIATHDDRTRDACDEHIALVAAS